MMRTAARLLRARLVERTASSGEARGAWLGRQRRAGSIRETPCTSTSSSRSTRSCSCSTRRSRRWAAWPSGCWRRASTPWSGAIPSSPRRRSPATASSTMLERELQEQTILMIARRQPMANDLRHIMTVLKIAGDLERIGDLAKNIAKRALAVSGENHPKPLMTGLKHMTELAHGPAQGRARRLRRARCRQGAGGVAARRAHRRHVQLAVPRAADLHDGGPAQHRAVHASAVRRQEHRAHRRPHHQHRRERLLPRARHARSPTTGRRATTPAPR